MFTRPSGSTYIEEEIDLDAHGVDDIPPAGDEFCHIESGDGRTFYCGKPATGETTCKMYNGEAVCPSCGLATCPSCAVMSSLNERLNEDLS